MSSCSDSRSLGDSRSGWSGRDVVAVDRRPPSSRPRPRARAEPPGGAARRASRRGAAPRPSGRSRCSDSSSPIAGQRLASASLPGVEPAPGDVGRGDPVEHLGQAVRRPGCGSSHSTESTISRSATPRSCSSSVEPNGRSPRQRRNAGQVGDEKRRDDARGRVRTRAAERDVDHLEADRAASGREAAQVDVGVERVTIVVGMRGGAGSSARDAARRARRACARRPRATAPAPRPCAS